MHSIDTEITNFYLHFIFIYVYVTFDRNVISRSNVKLIANITAAKNKRYKLFAITCYNSSSFTLL